MLHYQQATVAVAVAVVVAAVAVGVVSTMVTTVTIVFQAMQKSAAASLQVTDNSFAFTCVKQLDNQQQQE